MCLSTFELVFWISWRCSCDLGRFQTASPVWEPPNLPVTRPARRPHQSGPSLPLHSFHTGPTHSPVHGSWTLLSSCVCVCVLARLRV